MTPIPPPEDQSLRHHSFDGIQEFDRRLPNWWMVLLFGSILFWVGYWAYFEWFRVGLTGPQAVAREMEHIEAARLAAAPTTDNASLWAMSHNHVFVEAGRATYATTCVSCHGDKLQGFMIAGADRKFHWADAVIDGQTVVVSSAAVPQPEAVRYAWAAAFPWANLFNQDGLPAQPFRTDAW